MTWFKTLLGSILLCLGMAGASEVVVPIAAQEIANVQVGPVAEAHDESGSPNCVTWHEFNHADFNVYMDTVHRIFDVNGEHEEIWDATGDVTRSYASCADSTPRFCVDYWRGQSGADALKVWDRYVGPCNDPEGDGTG